MGLIGISLLVASFVYFIMYPSTWLGLARPLLPWLQAPPPTTETEAKEETRDATATSADDDKEPASAVILPDVAGQAQESAPAPAEDRPAPPPHPDDDEDDDDEATTPKATAAPGKGADVPVFSLSVPGEDGDSDSGSDADDHLPPPMFPSPFSAQRASGPVVPPAAPASFSRSMPPPPPPPSSSSAPSSASLSPSPPTPSMAPPPPPGPRRPPTLNPVRGTASTTGSSLRPTGLTPLPNRGGPAPSRLAASSGPAGLSPRAAGSSSLSAPPAARGRNKISLAPGHSPLDWAQLCADPTANLRNLPPDAPQLLRVKPSLLKTMNGRRGRDAWTALGGMVYNITPYVPFHPGGAGELLRCAGKDGTRLFQDVHAWVNYDNMLAACRIGILVDESHASSAAGPMEEMD